MPILPLVIAPHPIFKKIAAPVEKIDTEIKNLVSNMFETLYAENALGLGANMVGSLKRVAVIDLQDNDQKNPLTMINPEIYWRSEETQTCEEGSLCFPGISAVIARPKQIKIRYLDLEGKTCDLHADDFLSTVIQHEIDYLDGKVFLDYVSKTKRDILIKKMEKHKKFHVPHVHGPNCRH